MTEGRCFRGTVVATVLHHTGLPWGVLQVSEERCVLTSALATRRPTSSLGQRAELARTAVHTVAYERVRMVTRGTAILFLDEENRQIGPCFVPLRPRRVREELVRCGWPVHNYVRTLRGRWPEGVERVTSEPLGDPADWPSNGRGGLLGPLLVQGSDGFKNLRPRRLRDHPDEEGSERDAL